MDAIIIERVKRELEQMQTYFRRRCKVLVALERLAAQPDAVVRVECAAQARG